MKKKVIVLLLTLGCLLSAGKARALNPPADSSVFSPAFALEMLRMASGYTAKDTAGLISSAGFETLMQKHYDKDPQDPAHTCAWSLGEGTVSGGVESRRAYLLVIRGTAGGEWYSNFDFAPSHDDGTVWAENFLSCAEEILTGIGEALEDPEAVWMVTGHSRGAACANLLGMMLNAVRDPDLNYIYTSATPATVREGLPEGLEDANIFNLINPADLVPRVPLAAWGYRRPGTDILLPGDAENAAAMDRETERLAELAPTVSEYYTVRHLTDQKGTGENGLTTFEVMLFFAEALAGAEETGNRNSGTSGNIPEDIAADSDFAPLAEKLREMTEGNRGRELLAQHMPDMYGKLLRQKMAEQP